MRRTLLSIDRTKADAAAKLLGTTTITTTVDAALSQPGDELRRRRRPATRADAHLVSGGSTTPVSITRDPSYTDPVAKLTLSIDDGLRHTARIRALE